MAAKKNWPDGCDELSKHQYFAPGYRAAVVWVRFEDNHVHDPPRVLEELQRGTVAVSLAEDKRWTLSPGTQLVLNPRCSRSPRAWDWQVLPHMAAEASDLQHTTPTHIFGECTAMATFAIAALL